jgi:hypothetical protein
MALNAQYLFQQEMTLLRVRAKDYEVIIVPKGDFAIIILQKVCTHSSIR